MAPSKLIRTLVPFLFWMISSFIAFGQSQVILNSKKLFEERSFEKAKAILSNVQSTHSDYAEALYYQGRIAVEERKYDLSIEKFEEAIEINPENVEYHNWLGVMYGVVAMNSSPLKQAYLAPKIKNEFEKAASIDPDNLPTQWGLITYYTKAPGFLGGSWEKALACAATITRHNKAQGIRAYALVHAGQNKTALAEKEYLEAIRLEPTTCEHVFALAQFYNDQKLFDKAVRLYEDVLNKNPRNMVASYHLGAVSATSGLQADRGIACLNQYLAYTPRPNEPGHSDANLNLALIYEKKGDNRMAKKYYESTLAIFPGMKEAKEGLARVN
ncbi:MAG: tetratricopeptide repeat protein [Cyclobacteriaceae bacterium]|nr:tetratricopeptide repeat protein [Cyclobacteriaceae bacterium]